MTPTEILSKLATWARQHGGQLREATTQEWEQVPQAPFSNSWALLWRQKIILYRNVRDVADAASGIHELGHVFASLIHPELGMTEIDFLGWEYALARELQIVGPWIRSMRDYIVRDGVDFGSLKPSERRATLAHHVRIARRSALIQFGRAVAIR